MILHTLYPYTKRFTDYLQAFLGLAYAPGVPLRFAALGINILMSDRASNSDLGGFFMGVAVMFWNGLVNTIYSGQDLKDDKKAGIKSELVVHETSARAFVRSLAAVHIFALIAVGILLRPVLDSGGWLYFAVTCDGSAIALACMVEMVDWARASDCAWWFSTGNTYVTACMGGGFLLEYFLQVGWRISLSVFSAGRIHACHLTYQLSDVSKEACDFS